MKRIELSMKYLMTANNCRVQLFNRKHYVLQNGFARMQIPIFKEGKTVFESIGKELPIVMIYSDIKCVFHLNKLLAVRTTRDEQLIVRKEFAIQIFQLQKRRKIAYKIYKKFVAEEFHSWLSSIKIYCDEHY